MIGFKEETLHFDVVIVGGGMTGLCAAIASARHGAKTALVQDRPVLGGNASSEIRMHICGATANMKKPELSDLETNRIPTTILCQYYRNFIGVTLLSGRFGLFNERDRHYDRYRRYRSCLRIIFPGRITGS